MVINKTSTKYSTSLNKNQSTLSCQPKRNATRNSHKNNGMLVEWLNILVSFDQDIFEHGYGTVELDMVSTLPHTEAP